jgi:hypothetical protein
MSAVVQATTLRTMPALIKTVNAIHAKAIQADDKAAQLWITLGIELKEAKARNKETGGVPWPEFAKLHFNFGQSRADELIRIADGRTNVDEVRIGNTKRSIESREQKAALRNADSSRAGAVETQDECDLGDDPEGDRLLYMSGARHSIMFANYNGPIDDEIVSAAALVAKSWTDLHDKLKGNRNVRRDNVGVKSKADRAKSRLERDRKTCVSLYLNATEASRPLEQFLLDHPGYSAPP